MYIKEFEVRWNDIDANRHLSNSAFISFMSHTRHGFMYENGFEQADLVRKNICSVVFFEHMFYFKEAFLGESIRVSLQLKGISEGGMYFQYLHNFYNEQGVNIARCEMMGGWINLSERKLRNLPEDLLKSLSSLSKTDDFKILTKEDTRKFGQVPQHLK